MSSIDLQKNADNPCPRQLLHSLLAYMGSERFAPTIELTADQVAGLFAEPTALQRLGARVIKVSKRRTGARGSQGDRRRPGDPVALGVQR
ncbi:MAG: hypothetical protein U0736_16485 [Gemmataceae bacterium]